MRKYLILLFVLLLFACQKNNKQTILHEAFPVFVTDTTPNDTDDPAIWYNASKPEESLILGTDKGDSTGGIFVFDLKGKLIPSLCLTNLARPNNVDVEYGLKLNGITTDIAVFTERNRKMIRVISVPDFKFIDNGGIPVFEGEVDSMRLPMGIALYKDKNDDIFAMVGRKTGPSEGYIYQYKIIHIDSTVAGLLVRKFGKFSGNQEIESIVVDDELGFVYYSDEMIGIRKYYADADKGNEELALFATSGIVQDHEGLSIFKESSGNGYIVLSDQQANKFHLFNRKGSLFHPHSHQCVRIVKVQTNESDGSDIINLPLNNEFKNGLFVAMSDNKTFQFYRAEDITGKK